MVISNHLNQSRRKVYYHLDKINEALPDGVEKIVSYPRIGIKLTAEQKAACRRMLDELSIYSYVMSVSERIKMLLTYIAISKERVTLEKLVQLGAVSRNTILNDLNDIRHQLVTNEYDIQLHVTKARGYYLDCHPLSKIQFLYRLLYDIHTSGNQEFINIVRERIIDLTGFDRYFSPEVKHYLRQQLSSAQESLGKKINGKDSQFMEQILPYLLLSYQSIDMTDKEKELIQRDFSITWDRKEYRLAHQISDDLAEKFDIHLDEIEVSLIAMLLLSFRKDSDSNNESSDYDDIRLVLSNYLDAITKAYGLVFNHRDALLNQLITHCKALLYRKTYGILSINPLTKYIKAKYDSLFKISKSKIAILEEAWLIQMTDDDIAHITIHLGGELQRDEDTFNRNKHVVIVCDEGIDVQKLLLSQCRDYLNYCEIDAVFTSEQFHSVSDLVTVNAVISTSDAIDSCFPVIVVHPILSDDDMIKLIRFSNNRDLREESRFDHKLELCLLPYISDSKERYILKSQIERLVSQELIGGNPVVD